ncbi:MAG: D-amino-acid transaminase [Kiloniellales bacterium]
MPRFAYVSGRYVAHHEAAVHVEDRGYQFADGVYEVVTIHGGRLVDMDPHLDRLDRSLGELRIRWPMSRRALKLVMRELIERNRVRDGIIYLQVTRGVAPREHAFPDGCAPQLVMTTKVMKPQSPQMVEDGVKVITVPDIRWQRCDIKSISLLPNCLAKQQAIDGGAYEAWQVDADGQVTEGSSTNAWIVTKDGKLITRNVNSAILNGITRLALIRIARAEGVELEERAFTVDEARAAREAFITSSTSFVLPVTKVDEQVLGNGKSGSLTLRLRGHYMDYMAGKRDPA